LAPGWRTWSATRSCSSSRNLCASSWTRWRRASPGLLRRQIRSARCRILWWRCHDMEGNTVTVKMAEMNVVTDGRSLKTILGSCVGVIVRDPDRRVSGLAHIMLPSRRHDDEATGKYADSAIPELLARLARSGCRMSSLQGLLIGGAQMFPMGHSSLSSIGDQNVEAA